MKNDKQTFIEWATECMGWSVEDIQSCIDDNDYQIINHIPDDEDTISQLEAYLLINN